MASARLSQCQECPRATPSPLQPVPVSVGATSLPWVPPDLSGPAGVTCPHPWDGDPAPLPQQPPGFAPLRDVGGCPSCLPGARAQGQQVDRPVASPSASSPAASGQPLPPGPQALHRHRHRALSACVTVATLQGVGGSSWSPPLVPDSTLPDLPLPCRSPDCWLSPEVTSVSNQTGRLRRGQRRSWIPGPPRGMAGFLPLSPAPLYHPVPCSSLLWPPFGNKSKP